MHTEYAIEIVTGTRNENIPIPAETADRAMEQIRHYLSTHVPDGQVFLSWHRPDDGAQGYLNSDGNASVVGRPWRY